MTRFARRGFENRKLNEATPWSDLNKKGKRGGVQKHKSKEERRDGRRWKRQDERETKKVCFNCRTPGHRMSDCPFLSEASQQGICFKCGSTEHTSVKCTAKIAKDSYPFAQCFICGTRGHISKQCPDNPRGLYPKGGSCKCCGSVEHLKRDCPEFLSKKGVKEVTADVITDGQSADAEPTPMPSVSSQPDGDTIIRKKTKIVKF